MSQSKAIPAIDTTPSDRALPFLATDGAREHAEQPRHLAGDTFRAELADHITASAHTYAAQNDDQRPARVRAFDIPRAARQAAEDAEVAVNLANQQADPICRPVGSSTNARFNVQLGSLLAEVLPNLFESCVADAVERGQDPKRAVAQFSGLIAGAVVESGRDALKARAERA